MTVARSPFGHALLYASGQALLIAYRLNFILQIIRSRKFELLACQRLSVSPLNLNIKVTPGKTRRGGLRLVRSLSCPWGFHSQLIRILQNLAQTIVAFELLPTDDMLAWSAVLMLLAAAVLMTMNARMRGNIDYVAAALWGLVAVYVKQSGWDLPGSDTAAWLAAGSIVVKEWLYRASESPHLPHEQSTSLHSTLCEPQANINLVQPTKSPSSANPPSSPPTSAARRCTTPRPRPASPATRCW